MIDKKPIIVLASASKSRYRLLKRLRVEFEVRAADIDETAQRGEQPRELVRRLSCAKAHTVAKHYAQRAAPPAAQNDAQRVLIIGSDQCGEVDGQIIGKPKDAAQASAQLAMCAGKRVVFHTGLCLRDTAAHSDRYACVLTQVHYRHFSAAQAAAYVRIEQPFDCCGSHRSEGLGIALCERMQSSDPTAMLGLPLITLSRLLEQAGVPLLI